MPREGYIKALREHIGTAPLLMPSVTVFVRDGDRLLMGRHDDLNTWVVPGGALEPGEVPADAAVREVKEETGLDVRLTGLYGVYGGGAHNRIVYPNGDVVDYVAIVFDAEVVGGVLPERTEELAELRWVALDRIGDLDVAQWLPPMLESPGFAPASEEC